MLLGLLCIIYVIPHDKTECEILDSADILCPFCMISNHTCTTNLYLDRVQISKYITLQAQTLFPQWWRSLQQVA